MTLDEMIAVMQAAKAGKTIQSKSKRYEDGWGDTPDPVWNFNLYLYRVKPEPRTIFLNEYPDGSFGCPKYTLQAAKILGGSLGKVLKFVEVLE